MKLHMLREHKGMNLSISLLSCSPFKSSIGLSPSSLNRFWDKNDLQIKQLQSFFFPLSVRKTSPSTKTSSLYSLFTHAILNMINTIVKVNCYFWKDVQFVYNIINATFSNLHVKKHSTTKFVANCASKRTQNIMVHNGKLNQFDTPKRLQCEH
jgi:hypothetical protein